MPKNYGSRGEFWWILLIAIGIGSIVTGGVLLYFVFWALLILWVFIGKAAEVVFRLVIEVYPLWRLYRMVKQDISIPDNALVIGALGWLLAQCVISSAIAFDAIVPGHFTLFEQLFAVVRSFWLQILLELLASFLIGLAMFYSKRVAHKWGRVG